VGKVEGIELETGECVVAPLFEEDDNIGDGGRG
jgi:hypothetical protein